MLASVFNNDKLDQLKDLYLEYYELNEDVREEALRSGKGDMHKSSPNALSKVEKCLKISFDIYQKYSQLSDAEKQTINDPEIFSIAWYGQAMSLDNQLRDLVNSFEESAIDNVANQILFEVGDIENGSGRDEVDLLRFSQVVATQIGFDHFEHEVEEIIRTFNFDVRGDDYMTNEQEKKLAEFMTKIKPKSDPNLKPEV